MKRDKPSALDTVETCLAAIEARDGELHAWKAVDPEFARRQARALDASPVHGPLQGIPVGVKDIFDTADLPTEYGSPIYKGHRPAADAACVALARAAGAVIVGKTVTTEFATMVPGATVHPHDPRRTPGGSSSGSAAAVAAGMVRFAYGTQTVGSTIRPAAYCGVVGYKPSYGMISRSGMKMGAESLDTVGIIARNVADAALLAAASSMRDDLLEIERVEKPRLGVCRSPNWHHMSAEGIESFESAVERLAKKGARIVEKEMPLDELDAASAIILVYEVARGLAHEVVNHRSSISPMLLERLDAGEAMQYPQYAKAIAYAASCRWRARDACSDIDAVLTPSATGEAPLGLHSTGNTAMNRLWTLLHGPCVTVPAGVGPAGMPLGIQLVGLPGDDAWTLAVAAWAEHVLAS
ncbi:MAG TPA: amidase [Burkholderiales bacterium]|jgi:Asp-tRNA(Asn)/Glu-tRNA(Gln) amidotransferase A subunit family amidase